MQEKFPGSKIINFELIAIQLGPGLRTPAAATIHTQLIGVNFLIHVAGKIQRGEEEREKIEKKGDWGEETPVVKNPFERFLCSLA